MKHKSNFHKYNEEIYYEIINHVVNNQNITLPELEEHLLKEKESLHWESSSKDEFLSESNLVIYDLVLHGIILASHGDQLRCDIPVGEDMFEYLRDKGVVCNTCKKKNVSNFMIKIKKIMDGAKKWKKEIAVLNLK